MAYSKNCGREHLLSQTALLDALGRIISRVIVTDAGCHIWPGAMRGKYGNIMAGGFRQGFGPHRIVYVAGNGLVPRGLMVMHSCDQPLCCNLDHLSIGTPKQNMEDRDRKGRYRQGRIYRGIENPSTKVTNEQVLEIRALIDGGARLRAVAKKYGICATTARTIGARLYRKSA